LGEKEKAMEIMAKSDCLHDLEEAKDDPEPTFVATVYFPSANVYICAICAIA
jgi:hypothetical protein